MEGTSTATSSGFGDVMTLEKMLEALKLVKPYKEDNFMLITPEGKVFKGDVMVMFRALAQYHPLFKAQMIYDPD